MKMNHCAYVFLFMPIPNALVATMIGISLFKIVVVLSVFLDNSNHHDISLLKT